MTLLCRRPRSATYPNQWRYVVSGVQGAQIRCSQFNTHLWLHQLCWNNLMTVPPSLLQYINSFAEIFFHHLETRQLVNSFWANLLQLVFWFVQNLRFSAGIETSTMGISATICQANMSECSIIIWNSCKNRQGNTNWLSSR